MHETIIKSDDICLGYEYLQPAGTECTGENFLRYRLYLFPEDNGKRMDITDATQFLCNHALRIRGVPSDDEGNGDEFRSDCNS